MGIDVLVKYPEIIKYCLSQIQEETFKKIINVNNRIKCVDTPSNEKEVFEIFDDMFKTEISQFTSCTMGDHKIKQWIIKFLLKRMTESRFTMKKH